MAAMKEQACPFEIGGASTPGNREPSFIACALEKDHDGECAPRVAPCLCKEHRLRSISIRFGLPGGRPGDAWVSWLGRTIAGPFGQMADAEAWLRAQPVDAECRRPFGAARSGPNIPENDRRTVAVKLRLSRDVADELRSLAELGGLTVSAAVAELVRRNEAVATRNDGADSVPAFVHRNIVEALERRIQSDNASTKYVLDDLRAKLAKHERPKKKRAPKIDTEALDRALDELVKKPRST